MSEISNRPVRRCDGVDRRSFLKAGFLTLGGVSLADLLRAKAAADPASSGKKTVGDPDLARRRAAAARDLRPQARRPRRVPRPAQGDAHDASPASRSRELLPVPRAADGQDVDHPLDAPRQRRPLRRRPLDADRLPRLERGATCRPQYPSAGSIVAKLKGAEAAGDAGLRRPAEHPLGRAGAGLSRRRLPGRRLQPVLRPTDDRVTGRPVALPSHAVGSSGARDGLLDAFDNCRGDVDATRAMDGLDRVRPPGVADGQRARRPAAFDISKEAPRLRDRYGRHSWGQCRWPGPPAGGGGRPFRHRSTFSGWDYHSSLETGMQRPAGPRRGRAPVWSTTWTRRGMLDDAWCWSWASSAARRG